MEKPGVQSNGEGYVVSDGVSTPSRCMDLDKKYGRIPPGMSVAEWEAWQLADWSQNTSQIPRTIK